jgi:8-oxo-dGTP diphosphatase
MLEVKFYDEVEDSLLHFAVIIAKHDNKWVFCKHKNRNTYEVPGGHRDVGEDILETAKRELFEETGAREYTIVPVCIYSVYGNDGVIHNKTESFGMVYYADIKTFDALPSFEMEKIEFFHEVPKDLTYPAVHPLILAKVDEKLISLEHKDKTL